MKKIVLSLSIIVFLFASFFVLISEEKNHSIDKFNYAGSLLYNEYQDEDFDENDLELLGTSLIIELEESVDLDMLQNRYLHDVNDDNVEEKLAEYRRALKREYSKLRGDFQESFPNIISKDNLEVSSSFVFYNLDHQVNSYWDLDQDILDILDYDEVKLVTAYTVYGVNRVFECLYTYCGGTSGGSTDDEGPSNSSIDPKYDFTKILDAVNGEYLSYTGRNVKVGILDGSTIRNYNSGFSGRTVVKRDNDTSSEHATNVANIAYGNGGLAKDAIIYSASASGDGQSIIGVNNINQLQWFVDNGVSVVNLSIGLYYQYDYNYFETNSAMIDPINRAYDQFIYENFITLVVAAGNEPNHYIGAPGLSNNLITVGSTNETGQKVSSFSSCGVPYNIAKPNIVAPGEMNIPNGIPSLGQYNYWTKKTEPYQGTSFAAPMVTGAIALAFEAKPLLRLYPEAVAALLSATANLDKLTHEKAYYAGYDNKAGAGLLDIRKFLDGVNNFTIFEASSDTTALSNGVTMAEFYVPANTDITASLFWFSQINGNSRTITDYDLYIYLDDTRIDYSNSAFNNGELLRVRTTSAGTLRIIVKMYGYKKGLNTDYGAVAWSYV